MKVYYGIHNIPSAVPILSQVIKSIFLSHFLRSILILSSHLRLGLASGLIHSGLLYAPLMSHITATCIENLILLDFISRLIFGVEMRVRNLYSSLGYNKYAGMLMCAARHTPQAACKLTMQSTSPRCSVVLWLLITCRHPGIAWDCGITHEWKSISVWF